MPTISNSPSNSSPISEYHFKLISIVNEAKEAQHEEALQEENNTEKLARQPALSAINDADGEKPSKSSKHQRKESSGSNKRKVKILFPIQEEDQSSSSVDKEAYKNICKQCHSDLKEMKIGVSSGRGFIALPKLNELIEDIEALKTGNFIVVDN
jgi:hypothetical protein